MCRFMQHSAVTHGPLHVIGCEPGPKWEAHGCHETNLRLNPTKSPLKVISRRHRYTTRLPVAINQPSNPSSNLPRAINPLTNQKNKLLTISRQSNQKKRPPRAINRPRKQKDSPLTVINRR